MLFFVSFSDLLIRTR